MIELFDNDNDRGQVGIGTLIVFIAMVLVAAIAAGVLINTAGFLQSSAEESGEQSASQVTNRLQVVNAVGGDFDSDNNIGTINVTVKKAPGADNVDLATTTTQWVTSGGTFNIVEEGAYEQGTHDAAFGTKTFRDDDTSIDDSNVLNDPADRAIIVFETDDSSLDPITTSNTNGEIAGGNTDGAIATDLTEGSTATIKLNTQSGGETTVTLVVPESLSGKSAVSL